MENPKVIKKYFIPIFIISFFFIFSSCATTKKIFNKTQSKIEELNQKFKRSIRKPGEKMVSSPEETSKKYFCNRSRSNTIFIEKSYITPNRVKPGEEINHRIRYAKCPDSPSIINGKINRKVSYSGAELFEDITQYSFKPGTWVIDIFIEVPKEASYGNYRLDSVISLNEGNKKEINYFVVRR